MSGTGARERLSRWARASEHQLHRRRASVSGRKPNLRRKRGRVAVVTDSSCSLPLEQLGQLAMNIRSIPIPVMIGDQIYPESSHELDRDLPLAIAQGTSVQTSRPSPGRFAQAYRELQHEGYAGIVSVHLSAELSGTVDAAQLASSEVDIPVTVVDSRQSGLSLGHAVLDAAMAAQLGQSQAQVAQLAEETASASESLFVLSSLEQLRRGGRINALAGIIGSLLWVKPLLGVRDGQVQLVERPRTMSRAVDRLTARVQEHARQVEEPRIVVHGFGNPQQANELADTLTEHSSLPVPVIDLPPALAAHLGLGVLAVCISPGKIH